MFKYKFTLGIGFVGATHSEVVEYDEEPTENELEEDWQNWITNYLDGGFKKV